MPCFQTSVERLMAPSRTLPAKVPMSNGRIVNEQAILEIVDQLRTTIPEEVKASRQIQQQKERIIAQGE